MAERPGVVSLVGLLWEVRRPRRPHATTLAEPDAGLGALGAILDRCAPIASLGIVLAIVLLSLDVPRDSFRLPDDSINYVFTENLAETGKLFYSEPYTSQDAENLLHPRGALTLDERIVPVYFFGLPVLYAPAWAVLGEQTAYVAIVLSLGVVAALANAGGLLAPDRRWAAWLAVLAATPLVYMFSRPYLNVLPALFFVSIGANLLLRYMLASASTRWYLLGAAAAFALAAFMRYELVLFQSLLVLIAIGQKRGGVRALLRRPAIHDLGAYALPTLLLFVIPVLTLNQLVYGDPLTHGYGLLNDAYFPERTAADNLASDLYHGVRSVLLPTYELDVGRAASALVFQVVGVAPLFVALGTAGAWAITQRPGVSKLALGAALALAAYVYLYRGLGLSLHADSTTPNLEASIQRYSMPLYVACYFLAVFALTRLPMRWAAAVAVVVAVAGTGTALRGWQGNIMEVRYWVQRSETEVRAPLLLNTEADALIFTDTYDKVLGRDRHVAAWWGSTRGTTEEGHFQPDEVAQSIRRVIDDRPVYLFFDAHDYVMPRLEPALEAAGLSAEPAAVPRLYRVESVPTDSE